MLTLPTASTIVYDPIFPSPTSPVSEEVLGKSFKGILIPDFFGVHDRWKFSLAPTMPVRKLSKVFLITTATRKNT